MTLGLLGVGGASIDLQPLIGRRMTITPSNVRACLAGLRGPGGSSEAIGNQPFARSISSSRSKSSAPRTALGQDRLPSRPVGETFGIPLASPADFPPVLHPEGLRLPGVLLGWLAHSLHHNTSDPRTQEMRTSRNTGILDRRAQCSPGRRFAFDPTSGVDSPGANGCRKRSAMGGAIGLG